MRFCGLKEILKKFLGGLEIAQWDGVQAFHEENLGLILVPLGSLNTPGSGLPNNRNKNQWAERLLEA